MQTKEVIDDLVQVLRPYINKDSEFFIRNNILNWLENNFMLFSIKTAYTEKHGITNEKQEELLKQKAARELANEIFDKCAIAKISADRIGPDHTYEKHYRDIPRFEDDDNFRKIMEVEILALKRQR